MHQKFTSYMLLLIASMLPFVPNLWNIDRYISDQRSELPVKLWSYSTFADVDAWFGRYIDSVGYPNMQGWLNNPDIIASILVPRLSMWMSEAVAYNIMLWLIMLANLTSTWWLCRKYSDAHSALFASVFHCWSAMILSYCLMGAITDVYHVWPYSLAYLLAINSMEKQKIGTALASGLIFSVGFIICPYNFVMFTLLSMGLLWLYGNKDWKNTLRYSGYILLGASCIVGFYALRIYNITHASQSQMSVEHLEHTRHVYPFDKLRPDAPDRFQAYVSDYWSYGKENLIIRRMASQFIRACGLPISVCVLLLSLFRRHWLAPYFYPLSVENRRVAMMWMVLGCLSILASLGPYPAYNAEIYSNTPWNIVWLLIHHCWPGANLLLEPFRYALVVTFALSIPLAIAYSAIRSTILKLLLAGTLCTELLYFSSAPFPFSTYPTHSTEIYEQLDDIIPTGAIIELPYHYHKSNLFVRDHFVHQRIHHRPIIDIIPGFVPSLFYENHLLRNLLQIDAPYPIPQVANIPIANEIKKLRELGFRAIILTPSLYNPQDAYTAIQFLDQYFVGQEIDNVRIYDLEKTIVQ